MQETDAESRMYFGGICFITDRTYSSLPVYEMTDVVLRAGVKFVQYREKNMTRRQIYEEALILRELTGRHGAILIINDHADIALAVDADGVHLGQEDLPLKEARKIMGKKIVGVSTHDPEQAQEAERGGADYIGFGPVFETGTKDAGRPKGVEALRLTAELVRIPVVAIGGINMDNIESVFRAGASAAAMAGALCKGDISANAEKIVRLLTSKQKNIKREEK